MDQQLPKHERKRILREERMVKAAEAIGSFNPAHKRHVLSRSSLDEIFYSPATQVDQKARGEVAILRARNVAAIVQVFHYDTAMVEKMRARGQNQSKVAVGYIQVVFAHGRARLLAREPKYWSNGATRFSTTWEIYEPTHPDFEHIAQAYEQIQPQLVQAKSRAPKYRIRVIKNRHTFQHMPKLTFDPNIATLHDLAESATADKAADKILSFEEEK